MAASTRSNRTNTAMAVEKKAQGSPRALVVGINNYPGVANDLPSCVADASAFAQVLREHYGFETFKTLLNEQATVKAVKEGIEWLCEGSTSEDRRVFYYSGHGWQGALPGGDPSKLEEFLVLVDGMLQDDELVSRFSEIPEGIGTVVLDACFSGGMEKLYQLSSVALGGPMTKMAEAPRLKVFLPEDYLGHVAKSRGATKVRHFGQENRPRTKASSKAVILNAASDEAGSRLNGLLVAACREDETAAASSSGTNGLSAFTYGLLACLRRRGAATATRDLIQDVARTLAASGFRQVPQIKEPAAPPNLSGSSFILFGPSTAKEEAIVGYGSWAVGADPSGGVGGPDVGAGSVPEEWKFLDPATITAVAALVTAVGTAMRKGFDGPQEKFLDPATITAVAALVTAAGTAMRKGFDGPQEKFLDPATITAVAALVTAVGSVMRKGLDGPQENFLDPAGMQKMVSPPWGQPDWPLPVPPTFPWPWPPVYYR